MERLKMMKARVVPVMFRQAVTPKLGEFCIKLTDKSSLAMFKAPYEQDVVVNVPLLWARQRDFICRPISKLLLITPQHILCKEAMFILHFCPEHIAN